MRLVVWATMSGEPSIIVSRVFAATLVAHWPDEGGQTVSLGCSLSVIGVTHCIGVSYLGIVSLAIFNLCSTYPIAVRWRWLL